MADYSSELRRAKEEIANRLQTLERAMQSSSEGANPKIYEYWTQVFMIASLFGIQRIADLGQWAILAMKSAQKDLYRSIAPELLAMVKKLLDSVKDSAGYGDLINPRGICVRPWSSPVEEYGDFWLKINGLLRVKSQDFRSFRVPVNTFGNEMSLKLPSRVLGNLQVGDYYYLVYADFLRFAHMTKEIPHWLDWLPLLIRWTAEGRIVFQGPMDLPYERVQTAPDRIPYCLLLRTADEPSQFLKNNPLPGSLLRMIQYPDGKREAWVEEEISSHDESRKEHMEQHASVLEELPADDRENWVEWSEPSTSEGNPPPAVSQGLLGKSLAHKPTRSSTIPHHVQEWENNSQLSYIPFSLEELNNPEYPWPVWDAAFNQVPPESRGILGAEPDLALLNSAHGSESVFSSDSTGNSLDEGLADLDSAEETEFPGERKKRDRKTRRTGGKILLIVLLVLLVLGALFMGLRHFLPVFRNVTDDWGALLMSYGRYLWQALLRNTIRLLNSLGRFWNSLVFWFQDLLGS